MWTYDFVKGTNPKTKDPENNLPRIHGCHQPLQVKNFRFWELTLPEANSKSPWK